MAFFCQICATKLVALSSFGEHAEHAIVSTLCGHLYHKKCLDASITHQKLIHASKGTGPFRQFCPAFNCADEIFSNEIIAISTTHPRSPHGYTIPEDDDDIEVKLLKKFQVLASEKERLLSSLEKLERENESYREGMDEIKAECEEIGSLLLDDDMIKRGDRVFWVTKEGSFAPGRIMEMRKKSTSSSNNFPFAIIKLDRKTKLPSLGAERETAIVSVNELLTFKSFFKDFFFEFRHKLWKILLETKSRLTDEGRQQLLRSKFRESTLKLSMDSAIRDRLSTLSTSHEKIDAITIDSVNNYNAEQNSSKRSTNITRAKSMYFGMQRVRNRIPEEKARSTSWHNKISPLSENSVISSFGSNLSSAIQSPTAFSMSPIEDYVNQEEDDSSEYITVGERVIYYEMNSENPQVGEVASVLKYTPCAIVKFDEMPNETQIFKFRTVPVAHLFPFALASPEEKLRIAEIYGTLDEFMEQHADFLQEQSFNDEVEEEPETPESEEDLEEFFSTGSADDISVTIHEV